MKIHRVSVSLEVETVLSLEKVSAAIKSALAAQGDGVELIQIQTNVVQPAAPPPVEAKAEPEPEGGLKRKKGWLK